jgi:hypothetical protein
MGKYKDEWFDEFYGEYPEYDKPRWHTDGDIANSGEITFRHWNEATLNDMVDGWDASDFDTDTASERVEVSRMAFDIYDIQDELVALLLKKHDDYGPKNISNAPGGPLNGLNVRIYDKLARLDNLISNNKDPKNESLRDTFLDIANYAIIGLLVLDGKWDKK